VDDLECGLCTYLIGDRSSFFKVEKGSPLSKNGRFRSNAPHTALKTHWSHTTKIPRKGVHIKGLMWSNTFDGLLDVVRIELVDSFTR